MLAVTVDFTGPYAMGNWTQSGIPDGSTSQTPAFGTTDSPDFSYEVTLPPGTGVSQRTGDFQLPSSPVTGSVTFDYVYTGNHRFFQANAEFRTLVSGAPTTVVNQTTSGDFSFSGSATIVARAGQSFGFRIGGRNFDSDSHIDGTLTITNFRAYDSIVVDSVGDTIDGDYSPGNLTLREAISLANTTSGADVITFAPGMSGQTILLGGAQLGIIESLTIDATALAENVTIDAQQNFRVMRFSASSGDLTLAGLTMRNGKTTGGIDHGGGIRFDSSGTLTLTECTLSGNSTAGNFALGGGIFTNSGDVTLYQSTLSGNSTAGEGSDGGAIYSNSGAVTLNQSTLSGNSTAGEGSDGGAIYSISGAVTLNQSTLSGNSTAGPNAKGGGIITNFGSVTPVPLTIRNSIVAGNTVAAGSTGPDLVAGPGSPATVNFSLIGTGITPAAGGNNVSTDAPLLGPLANNGGPTLTHALLPGSLALDAGDPAVDFDEDEFDQRGAPFVRVFGGRLDIGAFEAEPLVVNDAGAGDDGDIYNGITTLREAIVAANFLPGANVITFAPNMSGQTVLLGGTELEISETLTIDATALAENVIIDAQLNSRVLLYSALTGDLTLAGLTMQNGKTSELARGGGGIRFESGGTLTVSDSIVTECSTIRTDANGGGIYSNNGNVTLVRSTVTGNSTFGGDAEGGGIYVDTGNLTLIDSTVSGNSTAEAGADGGGIGGDGGNVTLIDSTVAGNSTNGQNTRGGGIFVDGGDVTLAGSTLSGNSTTGDFAHGGGIYSYYGNVRLTRSTVSGNSTAGIGAHGGGIYVKEAGVSLESSTLSGNSTAGSGAHGGGIVMSYGAVFLDRSTVTGNSTGAAGANGGGIFVVGAMGNLPVTIANSILAGNTVPAGSFGPDLVPDGDSMLEVNYSLIGTGIIPTAGGNNISTNAPLLGPLADNGGPTQTHALLPGSPAIDAGDSNAGAVHAYEINGSVVDELGGPSLVVGGGFLTATGYLFGPNEGPQVSSAVTPDEYTIELVFSFDALGGYQKIIDTHDLADDSGLYSTGPNLHFYYAGAEDAFAEDVLVANELTHLVVTRDGPSDVVAVYVDGVQVMNFVDFGDIAVFNGIAEVVRFFQDDNATGGSEAAAGFVDRIRIYDRDLSADEVAGLVFDQRGAPFVRVFDGDGMGGARGDIGAFESQPIPPAVFGDYNHDGFVDAVDYTVWRNTLGTTGLDPHDGADGSGDGTVGPEDYGVWKEHYGDVLAPGAEGVESGSGGLAVVASVEQQAVGEEIIGELRQPQIGEAGGRQAAQGSHAVLMEFGAANAASSHRPVAGATLHRTAAWGGSSSDAALLAWLQKREDRNPRGGSEGLHPLGDDGDTSLDPEFFECVDTVFELVGNAL